MPTAKERVEQLKSGLQNPTSFKMEGHYGYGGRANPIAGMLHVGVDGKIVGYIDTDPSSSCRFFTLEGALRKEETPSILSFRKTPEMRHLMPIDYAFRKSDSTKEVVGVYQGEWSPADPSDAILAGPQNVVDGGFDAAEEGSADLTLRQE